MSRVDVRFIVTPFLPEHQPALGISSLISTLHKAGFTADSRYLNLHYGERIGWKLYQQLSNELPTELLLGEVLFTPALWGNAAPSWDAFADALRSWHSARGRPLRKGEGGLDDMLDVRLLAGLTLSV